MNSRDFPLQSKSRIEFINIDRLVAEAIHQSGVQEGLCTVFVPHTTAAVTINENADPDVLRDLRLALNKIAPIDGDYRHSEGNSDAHLKSSLVGASITVVIKEGRAVMGTWQSVYFCEFDGPRQRQVMINVLKG